MKNINEIADGLKDLDAPKSANHYVSTMPIPDWLEAEIAKLDNDNLALFA